MSVLVVGISHKTAPVSLLERVALDPDGVRKLVADLAACEHVTEATVIATCNRVEIYADVDRFHGSVEEVSRLLVDRAVVVVDVEVRQELLRVLTGVPAQQPRDRLDAAVEARDVAVDLHPVAGGEDGRLGHVILVDHVTGELGRRVGLERESFEDRHRGALVGDADHQDAHADRPFRASRGAALRCSW